MSTFYYAFNIDKEYLFDNFPNNLTFLIHEYSENSRPFVVLIEGQKKIARLGRKSNNFGTIYVLSTEERIISRAKLFNQLLKSSLLAIEPLAKFQESIIENLNSKTEEFIHNVKTLNSYSIQDLFALIPQETLSSNINKQEQIVRNILVEKPNVSVSTLLKLIKNNLAMKVEFSVFETTQKPGGFVQKMQYSIRSIILSILQIFIDDFEKKKIEVSVDASEASERRLEVDYDSLFVSLFYLLENSVKYCLKDTKYKIIFKEEKNCFSVLFIMISIKINDNELHKLTDYGYRSNTARAINAEGKGIGMYRIIKTLKLNKAELEITPRINEYKKTMGNIDYEGNQFKIKFIGQQNWFN